MKSLITAFILLSSAMNADSTNLNQDTIGTEEVQNQSDPKKSTGTIQSTSEKKRG